MFVLNRFSLFFDLSYIALSNLVVVDTQSESKRTCLALLLGVYTCVLLHHTP